MSGITGTAAYMSLAAALAVSTPALSNGCYARNYSEAHLAENPVQVVASIRVKIGVDERYGTLSGVMDVIAADREDPNSLENAENTLIQYLHCNEYNGVVKCSAECDSGLMTILRKDDKALSFTTKGLIMSRGGEGCSFALDLAERKGEATTYSLDRAVDAACEGL